MGKSVSGISLKLVLWSLRLRSGRLQYPDGQGVEGGGRAEVRGTDHISLSPTLLD